MKSAVVSGADGFIGRALTEELLRRGCSVTALVMDEKAYPEAKRPARLAVTALDFSQYDRLSKIIPADADCFFHLAWAGVSGESYNSDIVQINNVKNSVIAAHSAKERGCGRFLLTGSSHQYLLDSQLKSKKSAYGLAKQFAIDICGLALSGGDTGLVATYFTNVFGPGDRSSRSTNTLIRKMLAGEAPALIKGDHPHDWTYIDDAVGGMIAAAEKGRDGGSYYVGSRKPALFRDIVGRVRDVVAPGMALEFGTYALENHIDYTRFDLDALWRDAGFECRCDFDDSIRKTAQWLKELDSRGNQ